MGSGLERERLLGEQACGGFLEGDSVWSGAIATEACVGPEGPEEPVRVVDAEACARPGSGA